MIPKASLYDRYRLTNSTAIPMFQGSAGPEAIQVGAHLQGLYDNAQQGGNDIASMSDNIQSMAADRGLATELRNHVQSTIGKYAEAKDWENRVQEVRSLGQQYVNRASELAVPIKQYQEWKKTLDDKDLNLTPKQKAIYDQMAIAGYGGLKKDSIGRYVGGFSGIEAAKNLDVNKKADEWIKGYVEAEGGSDITTDNGITKYRKAGTWHILTPGRIKQILSFARSNDNEYLAYQNAEGTMEGFQVSKNIQDIKQLDGNPVVKQAVQSYMDAGYSLQEAAGKVAEKQRAGTIVKTMEDYAVSKYAHNNQTSISSQEMGDVAKAEATKKLTDEFRLVGAGVNTVPDWANDPTKLTTEISTGKNSIARLSEQREIEERKLAKDPQNTQLQTNIDRLTKQIEQASKVVGNNEAIWKNTLDAATAKMNLSDGKGGFVTRFDDLSRIQAEKLRIKVKKEFPDGVKLYDGTSISSSDLAEAMASGTLKQTTEKMVSGRNVVNNQVYTITLPDGKSKKLDIKGTGKLATLLSVARDEMAPIGQVTGMANNMHKDVVKNYSVKGNAIGLNTEEQKVIRNFGTSSATIYKAPGSNQVSNDEELRSKDFVAETWSPETGRYTGRFVSKDGKEVSEPMDIEMNTNIQPQLRARLIKERVGNPVQDKYTNTVIAAMDDASYSGILKRVKPNTVLTGAPDASGLPTKTPLIWNGKEMELVNDSQGGDREWVLRYKGGDVVKDQEGNQYRTSSINEADSWLQQLTKPKK